MPMTFGSKSTYYIILLKTNKEYSPKRQLNQTNLVIVGLKWKDCGQKSKLTQESSDFYNFGWPLYKILHMWKVTFGFKDMRVVAISS